MEFTADYKNQIAELLYSPIYEQMYYNFTNFGDEFFEDLRSYLLDELLFPPSKKKYNKLIEMFNEKKIKYYILNMIKISLNYPSSPFYKNNITKIKERITIDENIHNIQNEEDLRQNDENNIYFKILDNLSLNFIEQEIVKEYFWSNKKVSYRSLAKDFDVSYNFVYLIIKDVKNKIKKEYESKTHTPSCFDGRRKTIC